MFGWVQFPPELFAEIFRLTADTLQIIEVLSGDFFKHRAEMRHRHRREAVMCARIVQMPEEEAHQFTAFGLALSSFRCLGRLFLNIGKDIANGFHC